MRTIAVLALVFATSAAAQEPSPRAAPEIGPQRGILFIVGGGDKDKPLLEKFVDFAGGPDASIVVIPTAMEGDDPTLFAMEAQSLRAAGARRITFLHTRDRKVADSEAFVAPLRTASGVFFTGGRQWRLADAYLDTRTHAELRAVLARGGVVGGTSAGATILGSFLARGDSKGNTVMMGDHVDGMGFLKNVTIDQHLLKRNRQFDLIPVIESHPELLGIGIDENTAIVVMGDLFEVMGDGYVAIYDHQRQLDSGGPFYLLAPGDRFNLKTREAQRPEPTMKPLERVIKEPWKN